MIDCVIFQLYVYFIILLLYVSFTLLLKDAMKQTNECKNIKVIK